MDSMIEKNFIKTFVNKNMQDRFIFELGHIDPQKREHAIHRFAHYSGKYLNNQYIRLANREFTVDDVEKEITKLQSSIKNCYVMGNLHDGETMPIRKALEASFDYLGVSIVVIGHNMAFIKTETSIGAPMKIILHKK